MTRCLPNERIAVRLTALLLFVLLAAPAAAQRVADAQASVAGIAPAAEARLAAALDGATRDSLDAAILEARRRGLPAGPLVAKALEGVEKGAPAERIQTAVRAMLKRLEAAGEGLAPWASDAELVAGADAIAAGVPRAALRELRKMSPRRSTATALGVLAQLVTSGVDPAKATDAVKTLLQRGGQHQLLTLERTVNGDIAQGLSPDKAIDMRARTLITGLPLAPQGPVGEAAIGDAMNQSGGPTRARP